MPVVLENRQRRVAINCPRLRRTANAILSAVNADDSELCVVLVSDRRIHTLNRRYRKKDKATDVLAFPMREGRFARFGGSLLGDVVISLETAHRQATERRHTVYEETVRLLVHGILHLMGFDHERGENEAARMRRKENAVLKMLRGLS